MRSGFDFRLPVLALGGLVMGAVVAELLLRVFYNTRETVYRSHVVILRPDPVVLHRLIPGRHKIVVRRPEDGGGRVVVRVNRDGFRGPELRPRNGQQRVVVYGDSFIEAEATSQDSTFPRQLERQLARLTGADLEVVNAGVTAYGPDQVSLRVAQDMKSLAPDLVVVAVFAGNDFGDLVRNKIYRLGAQGELMRNDYHLAPGLVWRMQRASVVRGLRHLRVVRLVDRVRRRLQGGRNVEEWLRLDREEYREFVEQGDNEVKNLLTDHLNVDVAVDPDSPSARYKVALMEQTLLEIRRTVEGHGARLMLLIIPSPYDVCERYPVGLDSTEYPQYRRSRLTDVVEEIARRNDFSYLNLYAPFHAAGAERFYLHVGDPHWNDAGEHLAAELTAGLIRDRRLLGFTSGSRAGL